MNKKYIIVGIAIFLIAAVLTTILLIVKNNNENREMGPVPFQSFIASQDGVETKINNETVGLSFVMPSGWSAVDDGFSGFSMVSQDFKPETEEGLHASIPEQGCWLGVSVRKEKEGGMYDVYYSTVKNSLEELERQPDNFFNSLILRVDGNKALETSFEDDGGKVLLVQVPLDEKLYSFETNLFGVDRDKCSQVFDNFLTTISIQRK